MTNDRHTDHYGEELLELFLLSPGSVDPKVREEIERHLPSCRICSGLIADLGAMHDLIERGSAREPTAEDRRVADLLAHRGRGLVPAGGLGKIPDEALDGYAEVVEPTGRGLVRRIAGYVRVNPLKSAAALSYAGALAALALFTLRTAPDLNPVYAKFAREKLHVFNRAGDTIWTRLAPGMPERGSEHATSFGAQRFVMVDDLDDDGTAEVLVNGYSMETLFSAETLYCFSGNGEMKWKTGCGPILRFGGMEYMTYADWDIQSFFTVRIPGEAGARLFMTAQAVPYMTSKLSEIDAADGRELQAYWHTGGLVLDLLCDVAGDSAPEIVLGAINNAFRSASVVVLDPRKISGYGTTAPEYIPSGVGPAEELYYVTLGPTDLSRLASSHLYNSVMNLTAMERHTLRVSTNESPTDEKSGGIIYTFGRGMELLSAYPNDPFIRARERFVQEGRLSGPTDSAYIANLRSGVACLRSALESSGEGVQPL